MFIVVFIIAIIALCIINENKYKKLEAEVLHRLGFSNWNIIDYFDKRITVKSRQSLEKYDDIKYFKEDKDRLEQAQKGIERKKR